MSTIAWPPNPVDGQEFETGEVTYVYNAMFGLWAIKTNGFSSSASEQSGANSINSEMIIDGTIARQDFTPAIAAAIDIGGRALTRDGSLPAEADISLGDHRLRDLADPLSGGDAISLAYLDARLAANLAQLLPLAGGTMTGDINAAGNTINGLRQASAPGEAVAYEQLSAVSQRTTALEDEIEGVANTDYAQALSDQLT